jgi:hypothetical protein
MRSVDTAVLGTDAWGLNLVSQLNETGATVALVGESSPPGEHESYLEQLSVSHDQIPLPSADDQPDNVVVEGQLFDLKPTGDGIHLAIHEKGELKTILTRQLAVTAPAGVDLVEDSGSVPGADSAVTGLLIDRFEIEFNGTTERQFDENRNMIHMESGFHSADDGQTPVDNLYIFGPARQGAPSSMPVRKPNSLSRASSPPDDVGEPPTDFDWQDESMPEGFVDTKTDRLRTLMNQVLVAETDRETEPLVQEIEGLAGEIDSYSRFRTEPGLRRLRWKMLTAMNLIRPFLLESQSTVG